MSAPLVILGRQKNIVRIGRGEDLKIVAPFGFTSKNDINNDLFAHISGLISAGADIIQELSTYGPFSEIRKDLIIHSAVPYGTVLAYELYNECIKEPFLTEKILRYTCLKVLENQIEQGIDYTTIHASLNIPLINRVTSSLKKRAIPIPSRAGSMLLTLMRLAKCENPFFVMFDDIATICSKNNVVISLGSSLRPAAISDAMDRVQVEELKIQGRLDSIVHNLNGKTILEGLSHGLPNDVDKYCKTASKLCKHSPVTALGPLPIDIAVGVDNVAAAIGITFGVLSGISLVNVVSSKEHIAMPNTSDMKDAIRSAKLAAYVAKTIKTGKYSKRDRLLSEARSSLDWDKQEKYSLFKDLFIELRTHEHLENNNPCTICGSKCPFLTSAKNMDFCFENKLHELNEH